MNELDSELIRIAGKEKIHAGADKHGDLFLKKGVEATCLNELAIKSKDNVFNRKVKSMTNVLKEANEIFEIEVGKISSTIDKLNDSQSKLEGNTKKAIGKVKNSVHELAGSMQKVDKLADFEKLDRYATTLERIASSLAAISELEKAGKLDAIIKALK